VRTASRRSGGGPARSPARPARRRPHGSGLPEGFSASSRAAACRAAGGPRGLPARSASRHGDAGAPRGRALLHGGLREEPACLPVGTMGGDAPVCFSQPVPGARGVFSSSPGGMLLAARGAARLRARALRFGTRTAPRAGHSPGPGRAAARRGARTAPSTDAGATFAATGIGHRGRRWRSGPAWRPGVSTRRAPRRGRCALITRSDDGGVNEARRLRCRSPGSDRLSGPHGRGGEPGRPRRRPARRTLGRGTRRRRQALLRSTDGAATFAPVVLPSEDASVRLSLVGRGVAFARGTPSRAYASTHTGESLPQRPTAGRRGIG